jgi:hypothetical protein
MMFDNLVYENLVSVIYLLVVLTGINTARIISKR